LPGGQNLAEIDDVEYFKKKLYQSLNVPSSRMESDNGFNMGRSSEISRDELKFNKFTNRLQKKFARVFTDLLRTQLILKEIVKGIVTGSVKGGMTVDIGVIKAFLPGSLVDVRPVKIGRAHV
jgi:ribosomal protein S1